MIFLHYITYKFLLLNHKLSEKEGHPYPHIFVLLKEGFEKLEEKPEAQE